MVLPITEELQLIRIRASRKPHDYRCTGRDCSRLLGRAVLAPGCYVEIRCPKCGRMNIIVFEPDNGRYKSDSEPTAQQMGNALVEESEMR